MDATLSRLATRQERRELNRMCKPWNRARWDGLQGAMVIGAMVIAGYVPVMMAAIVWAHR